MLLRLLLGTGLVLVLVAASGSAAARRLAEKESVNDAAQNAQVLADAVVQPALTDGLAGRDPAAFRAGFTAMDDVVRDHVLGPSSVRVKIWTPAGRIVYSDEPALVGRTFALGPEEREVFTHPAVRAEVSDLTRPENAFERGRGKLLEVYRPVWTPRGDPLLFETYAPYDGVAARSGLLWRGFAGVTLSSLLALLVLLAPVVWRLTSRLRRSRQEREALLERTVEASTDERRRIAGTLHDGVIQDLAGASLAVSAAARAARDQPELAAQLRAASATVRTGIAAMRSLVVDIYPPNLETAGLCAALEDLVVSVCARDIEVVLDLDEAAARALSVARRQLVYRVAHETLLNAVRHGRPARVSVRLRARTGTTTLEVCDDGAGFDPQRVLQEPARGHLGLQVLTDVARDAGAELGVASAPTAGTRWLLRVADARAPQWGGKISSARMYQAPRARLLLGCAASGVSRTAAGRRTDADK